MTEFLADMVSDDTAFTFVWALVFLIAIPLAGQWLDGGKHPPGRMG